MQAMDKRLPRMALNVPGLELGVRSIPTNTPATTIVRQETVVTQIILQHPLLLVSSGDSAIKAKVFLVRNHSSLTRWQNTLYIEIANIFFPKVPPVCLGSWVEGSMAGKPLELSENRLL